MNSDDLPPVGQGGAEPGESRNADVAGEPDHEEFAEFADAAARLRISESARADGQPDLLHLHEMLHRLDQAASRLQTAGRAMLRPQDKPEPRWPVSAAVIAAIVLQWFLPRRLVLRVGDVHYILLALEIA